MHWKGDVAFGHVAVVFRGDSADNRMHAHAAVQCVFSPSGIELLDAAGASFRGCGWVIRSGVAHSLQPVRGLVLALIEPQSWLGLDLLRDLAPNPIVALPAELATTLGAAQTAREVLHTLEKHTVHARPDVDRRLLEALDHLNSVDVRDAAADAARHAGVSPSHLRALCRRHFGVPFSKLLIWRKVRRAFIALGRGHSLAQAAVEAGFADQAHLTRTMAEVVGLTAGEAARAGR